MLAETTGKTIRAVVPPASKATTANKTKIHMHKSKGYAHQERGPDDKLLARSYASSMASSCASSAYKALTRAASGVSRETGSENAERGDGM